MAPPPAPAGAAGSSLRPTRAAHRYRKGQAPKGYNDNDNSEDSEEGSDENNEEQQEDIIARRKKEKAAAAASQARRDGLQVINQGGPQRQTGQTTRAIKVEVKTDPDALLAAAKVKREESSSGEEESSEEEEERVASTSQKPLYRAPGSTALLSVKREEETSSGSEEETSSEEEEAPKPVLYKPVFVSKRVRHLTTPSTTTGGSAREASSGGLLEEEAAEMKRQSELEERRRQSTLLAGEAVKRELAGKETEEKFPDVDDTDLPSGDSIAFESWKLRELMRVKREREVDTARSKEREEIEARRALPEALRLKEDSEHAASLRAAKNANRGQQNFLQKYHHKGAFFADDEVLQRYDYSAPTEGEAARVGGSDVASLPKVMQVRNYGKMGRTKYTHLVDQDTSDRNAGWSQKMGGMGGKQGANMLNQSGCFNCGGNHIKAECPELRHGGGASAGPSGANASTLAPRQRRRSRSPESGATHKSDNRDSYRPSASSSNARYREDEGRSYGRRDERDSNDRYSGRESRNERRRSRSRSPRRDREREDDRYRDDKRRRRD